MEMSCKIGFSAPKCFFKHQTDSRIKRFSTVSCVWLLCRFHCGQVSSWRGTQLVSQLPGSRCEESKHIRVGLKHHRNEEGHGRTCQEKLKLDDLLKFKNSQFPSKKASKNWWKIKDLNIFCYLLLLFIHVFLMLTMSHLGAGFCGSRPPFGGSRYWAVAVSHMQKIFVCRDFCDQSLGETGSDPSVGSVLRCSNIESQSWRWSWKVYFQQQKTTFI